MSDPITWNSLWTVLGALILIVGTCFTIWRFFRSEVKSVEQKVETHAKELADYKTHVAETYISKVGHRETTDQILRAIEGLGGRIDSLFQSLPAPRRPRNGGE